MGSIPTLAHGGRIQLRYEHHGRSATVRWIRRGREVTVTYGRLAAADQVRHRTFASSEAGEAWTKHQHARLLKKGYWPGRHDLGFIEAIRRAPDDPATYRVYADWLEEQCDPRAELIRSGGLRAGSAFGAILRANELQLVPTHDPLPTMVWEHGFIREIDLRKRGYYGNFAQVLWGQLRRVLTHPSGHFVRVLRVRHHGWRGVPVQLPRGFLDVLERSSALAPCLREVRLPSTFEVALSRVESPLPLRFG